MDVLIPLHALTEALLRLPPALGREAGPLATENTALEAFLEDLCRERLMQRGPYQRIGVDVRIPPPPRDVPYRRHLLLAAGITADPEVSPAVRIALAIAGPRALGFFRRLALVADALAPFVDPALPFSDPKRAEELARRIAGAFHLSIEGESEAESATRLAAVDARSLAQAAREARERSCEEEIARAILLAAERPPPLVLVPE